MASTPADNPALDDGEFDGVHAIGSSERPRRFDRGASLVAAVAFAMSVGLLVFAAWLEPDPRGVGTHTQFGMAPCGFLDRTGLPCATCGMTTAFARAADGDLIGAFITQPAAAVLALCTAMAAIVSGYAMVRGMSLLPLMAFCWRPASIIGLGALVVAAWGYKIITTHGVS